MGLISAFFRPLYYITRIGNRPLRVDWHIPFDPSIVQNPLITVFRGRQGVSAVLGLISAFFRLLFYITRIVNRPLRVDWHIPFEPRIVQHPLMTVFRCRHGVFSGFGRHFCIFSPIILYNLDRKSTIARRLEYSV